MKKQTYAVGSKEGPVMYDGTVFKNQEELNRCVMIAFVIVAVIIGFWLWY